MQGGEVVRFRAMHKRLEEIFAVQVYENQTQTQKSVNDPNDTSYDNFNYGMKK